MRILIVTPTLNQSSYIEQTIVSVLGQLAPDDRYVVVDGGSTDGTHGILERYADRIDAVVVEPGLKQAPAIRLGFEAFDSDLCAYLNSDDLYLPGALDFAKRQFAADQELELMYGNRTIIGETGDYQGVWSLPAHNSYLMRRWDYIPQEASFWRRDLMDRIGGVDASFDFAMDYDLFTRMMAVTRPRHFSRYLAAFRRHSNSKTESSMTSLGNREIELIRSRFGFSHSITERLTGRLLRHYVEFRSGVANWRFGGRIAKELASAISSPS